MTWKELYEQTKDRNFKEVIKVKQDFTLKSKSIRFIKEKSKIIIVIAIIIVAILTLLFYSDLNLLLSLIVLVIGIFSMIIYNNAYTIYCSDNQMHISYAMNDVLINYNNIKSIYLEENTIKIFFKKIKKYNLIIMYETLLTHNISDVCLSTLFSKPRRNSKLFK